MVTVIQHVPFEGPAAIADWATSRGHTVRVVRADLGMDIKATVGAPFLVVMGGPMSVRDTEEHPWIEDELAVLRERVANDRPTLGVCLGAQLIARALGSEIVSSPEKEIGWYPVERVSERGVGQLLPETFTPLHWHGETFDLPAGALHLARTEGCANQAFQIGRHVLGLQFHIEATRESVRALCDNCAHEIGEGRFQMPADNIWLDMPAVEETLHLMLFSLLDALVAKD